MTIPEVTEATRQLIARAREEGRAQGRREGLEEARSAKDIAYQERDKLVAVLARVAKALGLFVWRGYHAGGEWEDDWRNIIFVELPTGQVSWHIHDSEMPMFEWVAEGGAGCIWDGHTTPQKYERLLAWSPGETAMGELGACLDVIVKGRPQTPGAPGEAAQDSGSATATLASATGSRVTPTPAGEGPEAGTIPAPTVPTQGEGAEGGCNFCGHGRPDGQPLDLVSASLGKPGVMDGLCLELVSDGRKLERADVVAALRTEAQKRVTFADKEDAARGEESDMTRDFRSVARVLRYFAAYFERGDHEVAAAQGGAKP